MHTFDSINIGIKIAAAVMAVAMIIGIIVSSKKCVKAKAALLIPMILLFLSAVVAFVFPQTAFYDALVVMGAVLFSFAEQIIMREKLDERDKQLSRQQANLLQRQVSPHFIYNALTAIQALPDNPEETKKAIGDFAKYLRQSLSTIDDNNLIPFKKELENVQIYFRLEKIRFGKSLQIEYDIKETEFDCPAMCVQILAENAVKHGVSVRREGGTVRISSKREGNEIVVSVWDNGVGFDVTKQQDPSHIGINNVRNRVQTTANGTLSIASELGKGTVATIRFHLK